MVCAAPRQSRRDKWAPSPQVLKYRAFKDLLNLRKPEDLPLSPDALHIFVTVAVPASWSVKRKAAMLGQPHRQKPDSDNLLKAVADGLYPDGDQGIWDEAVTKHWGMEDKTTIAVKQCG